MTHSLMTSATRTGEPSAVGVAASLALIDLTLGRCAPREIFTHDEAVATLRDVHVGICDPVVSATVVSIINDAVASYRGDKLLDRWRVLDPLLDIRRALDPLVATPGAGPAAR